MNKQFKGVGIDLDGTLLRSDQSMSELSKQTIIECLNENVQIYFVTGRPYSITRELADTIDSRIKCICYNGGLYETKHQCIEKVIDQVALNEFITCLKDTTAHAFFKGKYSYFTHEAYDKRFLYDHLNETFSKEHQVTSYVELSWEALIEQCHDILKVLVFDFDKEALASFRSKCEKIQHLEVTSYQAISFDVTAESVNKGSTLQEVFEINHWKQADFMAIGDSENDLAMFEQAGFKVAMGNALDSLKAISDATTFSNDEDGVAHALKKYILD